MKKNPEKSPRFILQSPEVDWNILFPEFDSATLPSGTRIFSMPGGKLGLCYLELVFENGRRAESKKMTGRITAAQVQEGSLGHTQPEIVDFFDYHGCSYSIHADLDFTVVSVSCLQRYFGSVLDFILDLLTQPVFPEENLAKGKVFLKSQLSHQLTEPDFVSYRDLTAHLYGSESPYAYNSTPELIDAIRRQDLVDYHRNYYDCSRLSVFYAGEALGTDYWANKLSRMPAKGKDLPPFPPVSYGAPTRQHAPIGHCNQTSLKMGCGLFPKNHPDYYGMYVLNTLLGDYFGSRLMKHIREEEGLTYDIHSTLDVQLHAGCFYISAELNPASRDKTEDLIRKELKKLRTKPVPDEELNMVRNYLNGHLLRLVDGPFQSILLLRILMMEFRDLEAFYTLRNAIRDITPADLMQLADRHLQEDRMSVVSAGA